MAAAPRSVSSPHGPVMAVNNALRRDGGASSRTTVLEDGAVQSRGYGTRKERDGDATRDTIDEEITQFLQGEGKLGWGASVRSELRSFFTVFTFITRLPGPVFADHHPGYLMRGMAYFPLAGALVGVWCSLFFDLARDVIGLALPVSACVSTAASFWVTGCFHEDGLADSSDGIGGGWTKSQILKIMSDTRLGTYGCAVLLLYVVAKVELLSSLGPSRWALFECEGAGPALLACHALARWTAPILLHTNPYVDEGGPKYKYYGFMLRARRLVTVRRLAFASAVSTAVAVLCYGPTLRSLSLVAVTWLAALCSGGYARQLLGGVMGDYLGATICVTETVILSTVAAGPTSWTGKAWCADGGRATLVSWGGMVALVWVWCRCVGGPSVYRRDEPEPKPAPGRKGEKGSGGEASDGGLLGDPESGFEKKYEEMMDRIDSLAKPPGSLGTLEDWGARMGALQGTSRPSCTSPILVIFAGDHGLAKAKEEGGEGCSAYPQAVTRSILNGLVKGGAAASVLCRGSGVTMRVVDCGVCGGEETETQNFKLRGGTRNCVTEPFSMSAEEAARLMEVGRGQVRQAVSDESHDVLALGEIGIGNTTTSSILLCALTGCSPNVACGGGATLGRQPDERHIAKKVEIVKSALLAGEGVESRGPAAVLARFGGAEIAGIVGAILEASERGVPTLVDGFICTVAALLAASISPWATRIMMFSTLSAERGHEVALNAIAKIAETNGLPAPPAPALSMGLRLGEGTGAVLAVPLLRSACQMLRMATLSELTQM